jgi:hypothetical protein
MWTMANDLDLEHFTFHSILKMTKVSFRKSEDKKAKKKRLF